MVPLLAEMGVLLDPSFYDATDIGVLVAKTLYSSYDATDRAVLAAET